ncbi:MAG: hypothetical protein J6X55_15920 [Victivallales bacterium]|nr:hypothetical protein [Victivallales bacterium]
MTVKQILKKLGENDLKALCLMHSTPGDEVAPVVFLRDVWNDSGWKTNAYGRYAMVAQSPKWDNSRPTILLCAHADSPGFIIQKLVKDGMGTAISLGSPRTGYKNANVLVKGKNGFYKAKLKVEDCFSNEYPIVSKDKIQRGDRVCFLPQYHKTADGYVKATFLDNRVGCWVLAQIPRMLDSKKQAVNVVLAVTGGEEMTGFGADVLADNVHADLTVCLDATYADDSQNVFLGRGPVLTVSDKSVLLSPAVCCAVKKVFRRWKIPLQEEIYNYSGTDSRAFPNHGSSRPVLAVLIPSEGNHSPQETVSVDDLIAYMYSSLKFCTDETALKQISEAWDEWMTYKPND